MRKGFKSSDVEALQALTELLKVATHQVAQGRGTGLYGSAKYKLFGSKVPPTLPTTQKPTP